MFIPANTIPEDQLAHNLLVATPSLRDGCFDRKVIFMVEHSDEEGSSGVILNQPTDKTVGDLLASPEFQPLSHLPVYFGGPVKSDQLVLAVFRWKSSNKLECHFQVSVEEAVAALSTPNTIVRAFVGYAGWQPSQLHEELHQQAWFTVKLSNRVLETPSDKALWNYVLKETSPAHYLISLTPEDITQN